LATVIDCFTKEVIGWSMAEHMRTELVTDALDMAARNHLLEPDPSCIPIMPGFSLSRGLVEMACAGGSYSRSLRLNVSGRG
jgi:hypothetical protein